MTGPLRSQSEAAVAAPGTEDDHDLLALEALAEACGVEFDPVVAREALSRAGHDPAGARPEDRLARLGWAARDLGVHLTRGRWSVRDALAQVGPGGPLLACAPSGAGRPVVVVEARGRRARVVDDGDPVGRWVHERDLARQLGASGAGEPVAAAAARPVVGCDGLRAPEPSHEGHGHHGPSPLRRLLGLFRPEGRDLWVVAVFAVGIGLLSLSVPITVEALVSSVQGGNQAMLQVVAVLTLVLLFCLGLAGAMRALQIYVVEYLQRRIFVRVVADLGYRLPRARAEAFDRHHGPELVNRFFDVLTVQKAGATLLLDGLGVAIQGTIALLVLAAWHPYLLGFNLALLLALAGVIFLLGRGGVASKVRESYAKYAVAGWLEEMVRHPRAFKLGSGQDYALQRTDALARAFLRARQEHFRVLFRQIVFGIGLQALASAAMLGLGGYLVIRNELTLGQLVAAELIVAVTAGALVKLGKSMESFYDLLAAVDKVGHLVDLPLEPEGAEGRRPPAGPAALEVRRVSFGYADGHRHGPPVLHDFSAAVAAGERVALVGPSGAGKSTLVELLYGLREPDEGHLTLDGVDLRDLRREALREQVVTVADSEVFDGTVVDNVRLGRPAVALADVRDALARVGLLEDVLALPDGLHTRLTTGGAPLSRGQAQRLMLARAVAGRPRLLILDESLDQLDPEMRARVLPGLVDRRAPWTLLAVTRDPAVIAACDRTLEMPRPGGRAGANGPPAGHHHPEEAP